MKTTRKFIGLLFFLLVLSSRMVNCQIKVNETGYVGIHSPLTIKGYLHINAGDGLFATAPRIDILSNGTTLTSASTGLALYNNNLTANNWLRLQFCTTKSDGVEEDFGTIAVQFKNRTSGSHSGDLHLATVNCGTYTSRFSILSTASVNRVQFFFNTGSSSAGDGVYLYTNGTEPAFYPLTHKKGYLGTSSYSWDYVYSNTIYYWSTLAKYSDLKLKTDISNIGFSALDKILQLRGVKYKLKTEVNKDVETKNETANYYLGFIAQEVKEVIPEVVKYDKGSDLYAVDYTSLVPVLVEAIKAQQKKIEELEAEIVAIRDKSDNPNGK